MNVTSYAGTVKWHNVPRSHVVITLASNKRNVPVFSTLFQWHKILTVFKCIFEEIVSQLSANSRNSSIYQDSHKNQYPGLVCKFGVTEPQYSDKC